MSKIRSKKTGKFQTFTSFRQSITLISHPTERSGSLFDHVNASLTVCQSWMTNNTFLRCSFLEKEKLNPQKKNNTIMTVN